MSIKPVLSMVAARHETIVTYDILNRGQNTIDKDVNYPLTEYFQYKCRVILSALLFQ